MTDNEAAVRRARILTAARWCFLNFGFAKTAFEDIAKRANLSRTLLYRIFKNKEEIYQAVFVDWLVSRHPAAKQAAKGQGSPYERLLSVCRLLALEPWAEMVGAPMGREFLVSGSTPRMRRSTVRSRTNASRPSWATKRSPRSSSSRWTGCSRTSPRWRCSSSGRSSSQRASLLARRRKERGRDSVT